VGRVGPGKQYLKGTVDLVAAPPSEFVQGLFLALYVVAWISPLTGLIGAGLAAAGRHDSSPRWPVAIGKAVPMLIAIQAVGILATLIVGAFFAIDGRPYAALWIAALLANLARIVAWPQVAT